MHNRPDRPSRTCCLDDCTLAHCRRSRGAPKKPGPTSPGDRLPKNATHTFDPIPPDDVCKCSDGLLIIELPVAGSSQVAPFK